MLSLSIVLAAARAGVALVPAGEELYEEIKSLFGQQDVEQIDQALKESRDRREAQHQSAQSM